MWPLRTEPLLSPDHEAGPIGLPATWTLGSHVRHHCRRDRHTEGRREGGGREEEEERGTKL